jgi:hypothetical protein
VGVLNRVQADLSRIGSLNAKDAVWVTYLVTAFNPEDGVGNSIGLGGRKSSLDAADGSE